MDDVNLHTKHHNKDEEGRSTEIEGYIRQEMDWMMSHIKRQRSYLNGVLDIGCDYGYSLHYLKTAYEENFESDGFVGTDPFHTMELPGIEYHRLSGDDMLLPTYDAFVQPFELIILNHSLEHFINPYAVLRNVQQMSDGYVQIAVPKVGTSWAYWDGHVTLWDLKMLEKTMGVFGFGLVAETEQTFREDFTEIWALFAFRED